VINAIAADKSGKIVEIMAKHGEDIEEDVVMFKII
jgi:biotin carboxyl carrier protein